MDVSIVSWVITSHIAQVRARGVIRGPGGRVIIPAVVTIGIVILLLHGCSRRQNCSITLQFVWWTGVNQKNQRLLSLLERQWHHSSSASSSCPRRRETTPAVLVPGWTSHKPRQTTLVPHQRSLGHRNRLSWSSWSLPGEGCGSWNQLSACSRPAGRTRRPGAIAADGYYGSAGMQPGSDLRNEAGWLDRLEHPVTLEQWRCLLMVIQMPMLQGYHHLSHLDSP